MLVLRRGRAASCAPWQSAAAAQTWSQALQDDFTADQDQVCLRNCTCPADGGPCILAKDCSIRIGIGGGRHGVGGGALLAWMATCLALGGGAALAYIHYRGIPPWLPIRERGYVGMYM
jgi:hypothetical protein